MNEIDRLLRHLRKSHQILGPTIGADDVCRLASISEWAALSDAVLPLIPPKKVLLPPRETLWGYAGGAYLPPQQEPPVALVGLLPCDLYALDYLDRVFEQDAPYQSRRKHLFLLGRPCVPGEECFCPPGKEPPPFDLFWSGERLWVGSESGKRLLKSFSEGGLLIETGALPKRFFTGTAPVPGDLEAPFRASLHDPLWAKTAERCLSCGACAAVCPTCYCFDVVDETQPDGTVVRRRTWDNCFFRTHGLVAGGHNFRPSRTERLRYRFEHKYLGFGALKGRGACVGCGRCRKACPVNIDLVPIVKALTEGATA